VRVFFIFFVVVVGLSSGFLELLGRVEPPGQEQVAQSAPWVDDHAGDVLGALLRDSVGRQVERL